MKADYRDITSRIEIPPTWWDVNGTPRWGKPRPTETNIYANESIAVIIGCQGCDHQFMVVYEQHYDITYKPRGWESGTGNRLWVMDFEMNTLVDRAKAGDPPHYGDPPSHGCVGDTMNSYSIATRGWWKSKIGGKYTCDRSFKRCNWPGAPDWAADLITGDEVTSAP